jgi:hypothetical protein
MLARTRGPANTARFVYLDSGAAKEFFVDYDRVARDVAAKLRMEAGRNPHDEELVALVGELSACSEVFRQGWASRDVQLHRSGRKRVNHPVVGRLDLDVESMELTADPGLLLNVYTAPAGSASAEGLALLASWAADQEGRATDAGDRLTTPHGSRGAAAVRTATGPALPSPPIP